MQLYISCSTNISLATYVNNIQIFVRWSSIENNSKSNYHFLITEQKFKLFLLKTKFLFKKKENINIFYPKLFKLNKN